MNVFQAIDVMRQLSSEGKAFFFFHEYSYERRKSDGVITVNNARLRKQSHKENNRFADYMLKFYQSGYYGIWHVLASLYYCLLMIMNLNWVDGYQV